MGNVKIGVLFFASVFLISHYCAAQDGMGGARNNGNVRDQIGQGYVPFPEAFAIEGMMSEHNFPVREQRCEEAFCVLAAMGHGLHQLSNTRSAYLLIEPISGINPESFKRAPQNLAVVVDRSGSMSGWKINAVIEAVHELIDRLQPRDRLALVAFDSEVEMLLPSTPVRNKARLHRIVDRISAGGTTNIFDGMKLGFEEVSRHLSKKKGSRIIVLTDERPNVSNTGKEGFMELTGKYARQGVALSILGVGLDLGTDLAFSVSQLKGGSYHYLENEDQVKKMFEGGLSSFVTPVAYDIVVRVKPSEGLRVAGVFGVPETQVLRKNDGSAVLRASTVFFDKKRSALVVRLEPEGDCPDSALQASADVTWSYVLSADGLARFGSTQVSHRAQNPNSLAEFQRADHYRGYSLTNFAELMKTSLTLWHGGQRQSALATLRRARNTLGLDAWIIRDHELAKERRMADELIKVMSSYSSSDRLGEAEFDEIYW